MANEVKLKITPSQLRKAKKSDIFQLTFNQLNSDGEDANVILQVSDDVIDKINKAIEKDKGIRITPDSYSLIQHGSGIGKTERFFRNAQNKLKPLGSKVAKIAASTLAKEVITRIPGVSINQAKAIQDATSNLLEGRSGKAYDILNGKKATRIANERKTANLDTMDNMETQDVDPVNIESQGEGFKKGSPEAFAHAKKMHDALMAKGYTKGSQASKDRSAKGRAKSGMVKGSEKAKEWAKYMLQKRMEKRKGVVSQAEVTQIEQGEGFKKGSPEAFAHAKKMHDALMAKGYTKGSQASKDRSAKGRAKSGMVKGSEKAKEWAKYMLQKRMEKRKGVVSQAEVTQTEQVAQGGALFGKTRGLIRKSANALASQAMASVAPIAHQAYMDGRTALVQTGKQVKRQGRKALRAGIHAGIDGVSAAVTASNPELAPAILMGNQMAHQYARSNGYGLNEYVPNTGSNNQYVRTISELHSGDGFIYGPPQPIGAGPYMNMAHLRRPIIGYTGNGYAGGSFIPY